MTTETELSYTGVLIANGFLTKHLIAAILNKGIITKDEMRIIFDGARNEFQRSTVASNPADTIGCFGLFWPDYLTMAVEENKH